MLVSKLMVLKNSVRRSRCLSAAWMADFYPGLLILGAFTLALRFGNNIRTFRSHRLQTLF
jgi:hypothetical protein